MERAIVSMGKKRAMVLSQAQLLGDHLALLRQQASPDRDSTETLVEGALRELSDAVDELLAAEEELQEQNEKLAAVQSALFAQRQRYRDLFDLAPDCYLFTSPEGVIFEANRAAIELLQIDPSFLPGVPLAVFFCDEDRAALRAELLQINLLERRTDWRLRLKPRGASLPRALVASVATVRDEQGRPISLRWLLCEESPTPLLDASAVPQPYPLAETFLSQEIRRLTDDNQAKDKLLRSLTHEMRKLLVEMPELAPTPADAAQATPHSSASRPRIEQMLQWLDQLERSWPPVDGQGSQPPR